MKMNKVIKKIASLGLAAACLLVPVQTNYAQEIRTLPSDKSAMIITAPLDSRPISIEYVDNLTKLGGDTFISASKGNLDFFSDNSRFLDHLAKSSMIRQEILSQTANNNSEDTTVIINTAGYITNGLVGSRSINNYVELDRSLKELENLTQTYQKPYYYVNATMPRTLPEERSNTSWPDKKKIKGLGSFYLKYHTESKAAVSSQFMEVTPAQFLLEWGYVESKKEELGRDSLSPWEKDFLNYFNTYYLNNGIYGTYARAYRNIYGEAARMIRSLIAMQVSGKLDELVISIDDFQLPNFIQYCSKQSGWDNSWIQSEGTQAIKYSFSRLYLKIGSDSIYAYHKGLVGKEAFDSSLSACSSAINYLHGVDEVPQLIYARDLVRRKKLTTQFEEYSLGYGLSQTQAMGYVGFYDSAATRQLLDATKNFVTRSGDTSLKKTDRAFKMYVSQNIQGSQGESEGSMRQLIRNMFTSYEAGKDIGLIEILSFDIVNSGSNKLFESLNNQSYLQSIGIKGHSIAQLGAYCSWNTGANAIGLGMAQAQVYGIAQQLSNDAEITAVNASKVLAQHLLEDGIYSVQLKADFNPAVYKINDTSSMLDNEVLKAKLNNSGVMQNFLSVPLRVGSTNVYLTGAVITKSSFPWMRRFECYVDAEFTA